MSNPDYTNSVNESYNRLKNDLREKYTEMIYSIVDAIKKDITAETAELFGERLLESIGESEELKGEIDRAKNEFYSQEEYKTLQAELSHYKNALHGATDDETEKITKEMKVSLDKISTLNVTLKNRLKNKYERLYSLTDYINSELEEKRDTLNNFKDRVFERLRKEITMCLDNFNDELLVLNETFGIAGGEPEIPFEEGAVKLELPIFSYRANVDSDFEEDGREFVLSENGSLIKN